VTPRTRAFAVPYGFWTDKTGKRHLVVFLQEVDFLLPEWEGKLKAIGGAIEPGEAPLETVLRELMEEVPGMTPPAPEDFELIFQDPQVWVYMLPTQVDKFTWAEYRNRTRESAPKGMTAKRVRGLEPADWVFPQMGAAVCEFLGRKGSGSS
jgi:hypothetical protein